MVERLTTLGSTKPGVKGIFPFPVNKCTDLRRSVLRRKAERRDQSLAPFLKYLSGPDCGPLGPSLFGPVYWFISVWFKTKFEPSL